jgi:hypothetical protein
VDGSLGTWIYILNLLYPLHEPPALDLSSVYTLLPTVHKYDFSKAITRRLMNFVKDQVLELGFNPNVPKTYVVRWLALSERLQLDELRVCELCLGRLRGDEAAAGDGHHDDDASSALAGARYSGGGEGSRPGPGPPAAAGSELQRAPPNCCSRIA